MGICLRLVLFEVLRCVFVGLGGAGTSSLFSLSVGVVMLFISSGSSYKSFVWGLVVEYGPVPDTPG